MSDMNPQTRPDDELVAALKEAMATADHPQRDLVVANAKDAFGFQQLDEELAQLVYDSLLDAEAATASRATNAPRVVVFETDTLSVEIEIVGDSIVGQIAPSGDVAITVEVPDRAPFHVEADELGCFSLSADAVGSVNKGPLRFQIERNQKKTITEWTYLPPAP